MKTGKQQSILLYDDNCPACSAYTSAFVKGGLLQKENRLAFSKVNMQQFHIDWHRAKNEIPLIDISTGEVKYGVEALASILSERYFFITWLMKNKWLNWFFHKLYKLISVNRKLIVAKSAAEAGNGCTPDYNYFYRWMLSAVAYSLFLIFTFTALSIGHTVSFTAVADNFLLYFLTATFAFINFSSFKTVTDVHAHLSLTAVIASFLFLFVCLIKNFFKLPLWCYHLLLLIIIAAVIKQLCRRFYYMKKISGAETQGRQ